MHIKAHSFGIGGQRFTGRRYQEMCQLSLSQPSCLSCSRLNVETCTGSEPAMQRTSMTAGRRHQIHPTSTGTSLPLNYPYPSHSRHCFICRKTHRSDSSEARIIRTASSISTSVKVAEKLAIRPTVSPLLILHAKRVSCHITFPLPPLAH